MSIQTEGRPITADSSPTPGAKGAPLSAVEISPPELEIKRQARPFPSFENLRLKPLPERRLDYRRAQEITAVLRHGTERRNGERIFPFRFDYGELLRPTQNSGLEGFLYGLNKLEVRVGRDHSLKLLPQYFCYAIDLLESVPWATEVRTSLKTLRDSKLADQEKYETFRTSLKSFVLLLKSELKELDHSQWIKRGGIYELFPRAFNHGAWRESLKRERGDLTGRFFADFSQEDAQDLRALGFDAVYALGAFGIGKTGAKGTGGGSPFAISRHWEIDPAHGSEEEVRAFVRRMNQQGVAGVLDIVLNHTALDSDLLDLDSRLFVHTDKKPDDETGYYYHAKSRRWIRHGACWDDGANGGRGGRAWFLDTLQLDLSNPDTRRVLIETTLELLERYGPNAFRVDMAYGLLKENFVRTWGNELKGHFGRDEFLADLIGEAKVRHPGVAFIAEAYGNWEELSRANFDLIYGFNDIPCPSGHPGWYQSLQSRDPSRIRNAERRNAFLYSSAGADMLPFIGDHDRPAPWRAEAFGDWVWGATWLTVLTPGPLLWYGGQEAGFEAPCREDGKAITFNEPVQICWEGGNRPYADFAQSTMALFTWLKDTFGEDLSFVPVRPAREDKSPWVGRLIYPKDQDPVNGRWALVLANPDDNPAEVLLNRPELGLDIALTLPACGPTGIGLIVKDGESLRVFPNSLSVSGISSASAAEAQKVA